MRNASRNLGAVVFTAMLYMGGCGTEVESSGSGDEAGQASAPSTSSTESNAATSASEEAASVANEPDTAHLDPERAAASAKARRALIGTAAIMPNAAACGKAGDTSSSVRTNDAAFTGAAKQRSGSSTGCTAPGALQPTDDALYYCFTCTTDCSDIGSWTYNKNIRTGVSGWTRNDLLRPEPGGPVNGSSRFCGF